MKLLSYLINLLLLIRRFHQQFQHQGQRTMKSKISFRLIPNNSPRNPAVQSPRNSPPQDTSLQGKFNEFMSMFKNFMQTIPNINAQKQYQIESRDKEVNIPPPIFSPDKKIDPNILKKWISDVVKNVTSSAFNAYLKGEMTFTQTKIFCSENIIKNIVNFSRLYPLAKEDIQIMDKHIAEEVLVYLAAKYPKTDSITVNRKLQKAIRGVDLIDEMEFNYFSKSEVVFELRENKNYNDLIMKVVNELIDRLDDPNPSSHKSDYEEFYQEMTSIFQKVKDLDWMRQEQPPNINNGTSLQSTKAFIAPQIYTKGQAKSDRSENFNAKQEAKKKTQRQQYKDKVSEYTHYQIGRKISEHTKPYSEKDINNSYLTIPSPQILRILTKWCEELQEKFKFRYFSKNLQKYKTKNGQRVIQMTKTERAQLDEICSILFKDISKSNSELYSNNYQLQAEILRHEHQRESQINEHQHIDANERIGGKLSCKIVNNLHQNIIKYLNKLIHGILQASKMKFSGLPRQSLPNFLSFKIGDLIRCKCRSKETEILRIYKEIERISETNPERLKIVRIKNRLMSGTNDILMNVLFNNKVMCEIQLTIQNKSSTFTSCSSTFNHYLYELERSIFGPLTEICSIWRSLDRRAQIYEDLVAREQDQVLFSQSKHKCKLLKRQYEMVDYPKSFICEQCGLTYHHCKYPRKHTKCSVCPYLLCGICRLKEEARECPQKLLDSQLNKDCRLLKAGSKVPSFGVCIKISYRKLKPEIFDKVEYQGVNYIVGKDGRGTFEIFKIASRKDEQKFKKKFIIFEMKQNSENRPSYSDSFIQNIIRQNIKQSFKKQKQCIDLSELKIQAKNYMDILKAGTIEQRERVKELNLSKNQINCLSLKECEFPNLKHLDLSQNCIETVEGDLRLTSLQSLDISSQRSKYDFQSMQPFSRPLRFIQQNIDQFLQLQKLNLKDNKIEQLPDCLFQLTSFLSLQLDQNSITVIPEGIRKLKNLEVLHLGRNRLMAVTQTIGQLRQLRELRLQQNIQLSVLPNSLSQLKNIELLSLAKTKIKNLTIPKGGWPKLRFIDLKDSLLNVMPKELQKSQVLKIACFKGTKSLKFQDLYSVNKLEAIDCGLAQFPDWMNTMRNIVQLNISCNNITKIDEHFLSQISQVQIINFQHNIINEFPNFLFCKKLTNINLSYNKIIIIPSKHVQQLSALQVFNCSNNHLAIFEDLSLNEGYLQSLETVILDHNLFEEIPLSLCFCPNLSKLSINKNRLKRIRPELQKLRQLKEIYANNNNIVEIPIEITLLPNIKCLLLKGNKINYIPEGLRKIEADIKIGLDQINGMNSINSVAKIVAAKRQNGHQQDYEQEDDLSKQWKVLKGQGQQEFKAEVFLGLVKLTKQMMINI